MSRLLLYSYWKGRESIVARSSWNGARLSENVTWESLFDVTSKSAKETYEVRLCSRKLSKLWSSNSPEIVVARRQDVTARESLED